MNYVEQRPSIEDYYPLYLRTGWNDILNLTKQEVDTAVQSSFICICAYNQLELVGFGRVISDGIVYASIYDVMVKEEFKNRGIGTEIVKILVAKCKTSNIPSIHLWAATGTAPFYNKLGFMARPDDAPGMKYEP